MLPTPVWLRYLGKPWVRGKYDCWSLVREVYADELGVELPAYGIDATNTRAVLRAFQSAPEYDLFEQIQHPKHLALAEFLLTDSSRVFHIGVVVDSPDGLYVMHNQNGSGVVLTRPAVCPPLKFWRYLNESTGSPTIADASGVPA